MRLLIVKTSSMGDVVHATAVVHDILAAQPNTQIHWLVEPAFAAIPQMHPGVQQVHLLAWRRWRKALFQRATWAHIGELQRGLRGANFDAVLDLQGLLKSALWARQASAPVWGYDRASARESAAAWFYQRTCAVPRDLQAVQRCRLLAAAHLGYTLPATPPQFGLRPAVPVWQTPTRQPIAVLIPNASRAEKLWSEGAWIAVGQHFQERGLMPVVLWGSSAEQGLAQRIAAGCGGQVPPFLKVGEMAAVLACAQQVVGLDTGFTHLAAALGRPTLGIYCDHDPGLAGITGAGPVNSIGGKGQRPRLSAVLGLLAMQECSSAA